MRIRVLAAGAALALAALAEPLAAGEFKLLELDGRVLKWGEPRLGSGATVTYAFATAERHFPDARNCKAMGPFDQFVRNTGIPIASMRREFERALAAWERVADIRFRPAADIDSANIVVGTQSEPVGVAFANVQAIDGATPERAFNRLGLRAFAAGFVPGQNGPEPVEIMPIEQSLICLNPTVPWKIGFDGNEEIHDLRYAFMHEIGHTVGLDHPSASGELMSFRYEETFRVPQQGDIAGAALLYGPRQASGE